MSGCDEFPPIFSSIVKPYASVRVLTPIDLAITRSADAIVIHTLHYHVLIC